MPRAAAASGWISDVLSREGSLWLESAFCKDERCAALLFSDPLEVVTLSSLHGLKEFFQALDKKLDEGYYLAGWLSYEAGFGFEPALFALHPEQLPPSPLGWFGVYREPMRFSAEEVATLFAGVA